MLFTAKLPALTAGAVLLGTWLLKMILAITVLAILKPLDFYDKTALVLVMVLSLVIVLGAETFGVLGTKRRTSSRRVGRRRIAGIGR